MSTEFIDAPAARMTAASSKYIQSRLTQVEHDLKDLDMEIAAMYAVRAALEETRSRYWACLEPVSLLAEPTGPEVELPVERLAHEAALAGQARAGRDPYEPTGPLPRAEGHVFVESGDSEQLVGGAR